MIPFLNLDAATQDIRDELDDAYHRFISSGRYVLGEEVDAFEEEYALFCGAKYCVGVASGLDALALALRALDVGKGDEVIVPSNTYIATWLAITQVGATIIPVEPDPRTFNIDTALLPPAITPATKVILAVNLYGQPVDYDNILNLALNAGVKVVTDNAQAHGARYKNRQLGGLADIECHSFYPSKNLGAYGEAGAITTNDADVAARVRSLRNYGSKVKYYNDECGTNSRLDTLQAAFLRVKLKHLNRWNSRRKFIAACYMDSLKQASPYLQLPHVPNWADPAWHQFVIRTTQRTLLRHSLNKLGISTEIHYPVPPHLSAAYRNSPDQFKPQPIAALLSDTVLSIPICPYLSEQQVGKVIEGLRMFADCAFT